MCVLDIIMNNMVSACYNYCIWLGFDLFSVLNIPTCWLGTWFLFISTGGRVLKPSAKFQVQGVWRMALRRVLLGHFQPRLVAVRVIRARRSCQPSKASLSNESQVKFWGLEKSAVPHLRMKLWQKRTISTHTTHFFNRKSLALFLENVIPHCRKWIE